MYLGIDKKIDGICPDQTFKTKFHCKPVIVSTFLNKSVDVCTYFIVQFKEKGLNSFLTGSCHIPIQVF